MTDSKEILQGFWENTHKKLYGDVRTAFTTANTPLDKYIGTTITNTLEAFHREEPNLRPFRETNGELLRLMLRIKNSFLQEAIEASKEFLAGDHPEELKKHIRRFGFDKIEEPFYEAMAAHRYLGTISEMLETFRQAVYDVQDGFKKPRDRAESGLTHQQILENHPTTIIELIDKGPEQKINDPTTKNNIKSYTDKLKDYLKAFTELNISQHFPRGSAQITD